MAENYGNDGATLASSIGEPPVGVSSNRSEFIPRFLDIARKQQVLISLLLLNFSALAFEFEFGDLSTGRISLLVMAAIFAAAVASSVAGFAFSAICGAILFHLLTKPVDAVEIMMTCSISIQLLSVITLKSSIKMEHLGRFLLGGSFGLPIGIYLLIYITSFLYLKIMGLFLIFYGSYMLLRRPIVIGRYSAIGDYLAGFFGGVTGGFAAFPGAFVTIWCAVKGWNKDQQRGVYQPFILIMQVLALALLYVVRAVQSPTHGFDPQAIAYVPAALIGTWCGIAVYRRLTERQFAHSVNALLVVSGLGLVA
ncbi:MAG TPA: sulfite exporter TauE/SafE family protein [Stellaceae bacterium]|nr:sulfite exporter TauE/SafE family protein [Stellaceae bacterium]